MSFRPFARALASLLVLTLAAGCAQTSAAPETRMRAAAPVAAKMAPGFMWGASTAGVQYEGGDRHSNWAKWVEGGNTADPNDHGAMGYTMFERDLDLAQGMGLNTFRLSIEWSRIEPRKGEIDQAEVAYYHRVLQAIHRRGMTPLVTLLHFSYPAWLDAEGGWENKQAVDYFRRYARFVAQEFGEEITWYLTFNEPNMYLVNAYGTGAFPPGKKWAPFAMLKVAKNFVAGHKAAYDEVHAHDPEAKVSFNMYAAEYRLGVQPEEDGPSREGWFIEQTMDRRSGKKYLDYVSFDYYCRVWLGFPIRVMPHDQWEVYPEGFYEAIKRYHRWTKLPVLIAENGMATADLKPRKDGWTRSAYMVAHVKQMQRAMNEGVPVLGYVHWSITDNFEWGSFTPRFGLYSVEAKAGDFRRVPTDGVESVRAITAAGGVTPEIEARYPAPRRPAIAGR